MAGLVSFELRVVELGESGGGEGGVIQPGIGGERGGDLSDEVAEGGSVEAEQAPGAGEELQRITEGNGPGAAVLAGPGRSVPIACAHRVGGDVPAAVDASSGSEAQRCAVVQREGVCVAPTGLKGRLDDFLVRELAEHFREQPGGDSVPDRPVQLWSAEQFGRLR